MLGEAKNQFLLTRGAPSTSECQKTRFLSVSLSAQMSWECVEGVPVGETSTSTLNQAGRSALGITNTQNMTIAETIQRPPVRAAIKTTNLANSLLLAFVFGFGLHQSTQAQTAPLHLTEAEDLVIDLLQSAQTATTWPNLYGTPACIYWNGAQSTACTECSSFVTLLWQHTYGWTSTTFSQWMGHTSPDAAVYHDTIQQQNGFALVPTVDQICPGDILAIVYYPEYQSPSGHVMIVQDLPQPNSSKPFITGTAQWTISVIDSTSSYHGTSDTRYSHPGGIGQGIFRLYTYPDGTVAGYTWSLLSTSLSNYYPQATSTSSGRHLVIGRLTKQL
jgi:hypothetical protein